VRPVYEIPEHDLIGEVLIPALQASTRVDIAVGFFSSHCLAQIAPGLASLLDRDITCRLLISPELSEEDREAIERGITDPETVIERFMVDLLTDPPEELAGHAADCLAYLVAAGTLDLRCVLMERGMFHKKMWVVSDKQTTAAIHGSGNLTARGLLVNGEQMTIDRPWMDGSSSRFRVDELEASFDREWSNQKEGRLTILPEQLVELLRGRAKTSSNVPTTNDFWEAWARDRDLGLAPDLPPNVVAPPGARRLSVPSWLDWRNPPYAHQERAIERLAAADYSGLLAIATGGGKTKTALISSTQIQDEAPGPLVVMVLVPTSVLASQWAAEVRDFGLAPTLLSGMTPAARRLALDDILVSVRAPDARTEVLISTLQLFNTGPDLRVFIDECAQHARTLLIADEAHNFGSAGFISDPPEGFRYRIGLSATPIRQYDADGTRELFDYFRTDEEPVFSFSLGDAIKAGCLTPYHYHLHAVEFSSDEMDRYSELTEKLVKAGFTRDDVGDGGLTDRQEQLLRERRALVEQASGKLDALRSLLEQRARDLTHALVYCSAKAVVPPHQDRQIDLARGLLGDLRIDTHMYTSVETSRSNSSAFLEGFAAGTYQVLLAMKVLDEGVDVPAAREAYLLASSTVEREWVQRRGRVLRKAHGKQHADLHDFIVVPPSIGDSGARGLLQSELRRATHFTDDAANKYEDGGPIDTIRSIEANL
jgi:superfamily II DNA or RNA helicase/HKD family nuclease